MTYSMTSSASPALARMYNARNSRVRSAVEHVFAHQRSIMSLSVRTIAIAWATVKIGMANFGYNMRRLVWLSGKYAAA
jgi:transposase, IS5 family